MIRKPNILRKRTKAVPPSLVLASPREEEIIIKPKKHKCSKPNHEKKHTQRPNTNGIQGQHQNPKENIITDKTLNISGDDFVQLTQNNYSWDLTPYKINPKECRVVNLKEYVNVNDGNYINNKIVSTLKPVSCITTEHLNQKEQNIIKVKEIADCQTRTTECLAKLNGKNASLVSAKQSDSNHEAWEHGRSVELKIDRRQQKRNGADAKEVNINRKRHSEHAEGDSLIPRALKDTNGHSKIPEYKVLLSSSDPDHKSSGVKSNEVHIKISCSARSGAAGAGDVAVPERMLVVSLDALNRLLCPHAPCDRLFLTADALVQHIDDEHNPDNKYKCGWGECQRRFMCESELVTHRRSHLDAAALPHRCPALVVTTDADTQEEQQGQHREQGEQGGQQGQQARGRSAPCCKGFAERASLLAHIKRDHTAEDAPHQCGECSRRFMWESGLRAHRRWHAAGAGGAAVGAGGAGWACAAPGCGRAFAVRCRLVEHSRTHSGDRPYRCAPPCLAAFRTASKLRRHARAHTGDRRHACPQCARAFLRADHLRDHLARHDHPAARPKHACPYAGCEQVFSNRSTLYLHVKKHRPAPPAPPAPLATPPSQPTSLPPTAPAPLATQVPTAPTSLITPAPVAVITPAPTTLTTTATVVPAAPAPPDAVSSAPAAAATPAAAAAAPGVVPGSTLAAPAADVTLIGDVGGGSRASEAGGRCARTHCPWPLGGRAGRAQLLLDRPAPEPITPPHNQGDIPYQEHGEIHYLEQGEIRIHQAKSIEYVEVHDVQYQEWPHVEYRPGDDQGPEEGEILYQSNAEIQYHGDGEVQYRSLQDPQFAEEEIQYQPEENTVVKEINYQEDGSPFQEGSVQYELEVSQEVVEYQPEGEIHYKTNEDGSEQVARDIEYQADEQMDTEDDIDYQLAEEINEIPIKREEFCIQEQHEVQYQDVKYNMETVIQYQEHEEFQYQEDEIQYQEVDVVQENEQKEVLYLNEHDIEYAEQDSRYYEESQILDEGQGEKEGEGEKEVDAGSRGSGRGGGPGGYGVRSDMLLNGNLPAMASDDSQSEMRCGGGGGGGGGALVVLDSLDAGLDSDLALFPSMPMPIELMQEEYMASPAEEDYSFQVLLLSDNSISG